jgi:hypothetical protein
MARIVISIRHLLGEAPAVIELGSQTYDGRLDDYPKVKTVPEFYHQLGFETYDSVDFNGRGTIHKDLNFILQLEKTYDLVTNNGAGEHIFNQAAVFESCHGLCSIGGIMIHILPWINYLNHGFYSYHPILFQDMAVDNDYEVVKITAADRFGKFVRGKFVEGAMFEKPIKPIALKHNIFVVAVLKKRNESRFVFPTQGAYRKRRAPSP